MLASRRRPGMVLVLKGNQPLELRIHRRHRAVLYTSDPAFLDAVLADERGWRPLPLEPRCPSSRRARIANRNRRRQA
ncbi:MAG: hypothetical protein D6721_01505 [Gammaproteobacteria bacterium]|nr:MAG: hypothetical protein D6721_01505 [Gammaproteobacteria bacterium]